MPRRVGILSASFTISAAALGMAIAAAALLATGPSAATRGTPTVACSDSVYQTTARNPPPSFEALRLGPAVFNRLAVKAHKLVTPPTRTLPFFNVASFFNILISAPRGVTIRLTGGNRLDRLAAGRVGPGQAARTLRFPLCRDPETHAPLITQYGLSFLLRKQGCFTVEVQPVGSLRRYSATIPVGVRNC